jgi:hypothetical protein
LLLPLFKQEKTLKYHHGKTMVFFMERQEVNKLSLADDSPLHFDKLTMQYFVIRWQKALSTILIRFSVCWVTKDGVRQLIYWKNSALPILFCWIL